MTGDNIIPTIGEERHFYGYIVGLYVGNVWNRKMHVTFEYNYKRQEWIVPDYVLFVKLSSHLINMAWTRNQTDDTGYEKLWISKDKNGKWCLELP